MAQAEHPTPSSQGDLRLRSVLHSFDCPTASVDAVRERARAFADKHFPGRDDAALLEDGSVLGNYSIERILGWGGQAVVYLASHRHAAKRFVALKVPHRDCATRLIAEGRTLAELNHPNLVRMLDVDPASEPPFLVLEFCAGGSLADRLAHDGPLSEDETLRIAREILEALAYAHGQGIVHRDLKPENILFDEQGAAHIADFGLGKVAAEQLSFQMSMASHTGLVGTPMYLAPEQERPGAQADPRSDLFAFGKMLYAMLSGESPRTLRPLEQLRTDLSAGWTPLIFKLTEADAKKRYASATEALAALNGLQSTPAAKPKSKPEPSAAKSGRAVLWACMVAALFVASGNMINKSDLWFGDQLDIELPEALLYRLESNDFNGNLRQTGRGPVWVLGYHYGDSEDRLERCGLEEDDAIVDLPVLQIESGYQARDAIMGLFQAGQDFQLRVLREDRLLTIRYSFERSEPLPQLPEEER